LASVKNPKCTPQVPLVTAIYQLLLKLHTVIGTMFGVKLTLQPLKKYCPINGIWTSDMLSISCDLQRFIAIHNSSPVDSWDSKVSIECALQNLGGISRSSR